MTQGFLPGSRRFAEALLALAATLALAAFARAEDAPPATTTNADAAQRKVDEPPPLKSRMPARPAAPARPAREAKPAREERPTSNAKPAATATLAQAGRADDPSKPVEPPDAAKPAAVADPAGTTKPAETEKPAGAAKPADVAADAVNPAETAKPADTATPTEAAKPGEAATPAEASTPTDTAKPVEAATPADTAKPAEAATPTDTAKPAEAAKPAGTAKPAEAPRPTPASSTPEAEAVWRAYEKRWSETDDYSAGFRQIIEVPDVGSRIESAGRFYFAKPGLVRWEYSEGPPQTVVGDGTWIWLYQPDLEQVYKIPYAKAFGRGGLVELLAGREGVSERYRATLERPDATSVRILLKPLEEGSGNLEVTLGADSFDIREVVVHDAAGSTTKMTFAEPRRNHGIDKARFTFTPPEAVDIITENEAGF